MERDEAAAEVQRLTQEIAEQQEVADTALRRVSAFQTIIRGYLELYPDIEVPPTVSGQAPDASMGRRAKEGNSFYNALVSMAAPKGTDAVRQIMQERPDHDWYVSELVNELRERGWLPASDNPASAVRAAVERLLKVDDSDIYKHVLEGKVVYRYAPDDAPSYDEEPF